MQLRKIKVLLCGHDLKFIRPFISHLSLTDSYELRTLEHKGHHLNDTNAATAGLEWADVIFCEWALGNTVWFAQHKKKHQVLIVRLHLQEVQARDRIDFIWQTDWSKVDRLILITEHIYDWMLAEFPSLAGTATLVYNPIPAKSEFGVEKNPDSRFTLGFVGAVPARKRIDLAFDVLRELRKSDKRYVLKVKGGLPQDYSWMKHRTDELAWYAETFARAADLVEQGAVRFDGYGSDMAAWYRDVGHILSMSDFEGSHQAVAEGMATGCLPAIRDWTGADRIYPPKYVRSTVAELAEIILTGSNHQKFIETSMECRSFAQRFDNDVICTSLESIIQRELKKKDAAPSPAVPVLHALPSVAILAYVPLGNRGGYRIRVEQEIRQFAQLGCEIQLLCLLPPRHKGPGAQMDDICYASECESHKESFSALGCIVHLVEIDDFFRMNVDNSSFASEIIRMVDIIKKSGSEVIHAEALYCARVGAILKRAMPGLIFSIDWHGVVPEETRMAGAHQSRIDALEISERQLLSTCDLNIFVSKAMQNHYERKYSLSALASVIVPCCVADERYITTDEDRHSPLPHEQVIFGYAGTMADWQCGSEMISLFAKLHSYDHGCQFTLLIPKGDQAKVDQFAKQSGLPDSAYTMTEVPHNLVAKHLSKCDVGVLIRLDDPVNRVSSPTKFGEYLAAGLPLLMTDCIGDFSKLALDAGISFNLSPKAVKDSFTSVAEVDLQEILDFAKRARLRKREISPKCRSIAKQHLSWGSAVPPWLDAYRQKLQR